MNTILQTLTPEAWTVLNQSIAEAANRRHGQATPLHVVATLLYSPSGLFRHACALSQTISSHPLHCRALELCFSVALDRLPASSSPYSSLWRPSISNALMAALKRAQAHQRRGCNEHQHLIAKKVELEQLIISILDDPSVSRVMREARFSSPAVKIVIQQCFLSRPLFLSPSSSLNLDESPVRTDLVLGLPEKERDDLFKRIRNSLYDKVYWQREAAATISSTLVRCRGGIMKRTDSWFLFRGDDELGKTKMAEALSELFFSASPVIFSSEDPGAIDKLTLALRRNPRSVIMVEDAALTDALFLQKLKQYTEGRFFADSNDGEFHLGGAIFILIFRSSGKKIFVGERSATKKKRLDLNLAACFDEEALENSSLSSDVTEEHIEYETPKELQEEEKLVSEIVRLVDAVVVFEVGRVVTGDRCRVRRRDGGAAS